MKSVRTILFAAIAIIVVDQSIAQAQSGSAAHPASMSTSGSSSGNAKVWGDQSHWRSFLEIAAKPEAAVTLEDVKKAFGSEKILSPLQNVYEIPHVLHYNASVTPRFHDKYPGRSQIYITLYFHDGNLSTCPSKEQMLGDLHAAGWAAYRNLPERTESGVDGIRLYLNSEADFLKADQGVLKLIYENGCPDQVFMQVDKIEYDEIKQTLTKENGQ